MLSYHAVKLLSRIICLLPHGTAMVLGELLARLAWHFIPAKRKTLACGQVMRCLGVSEDEADEAAERRKTEELSLAEFIRVEFLRIVSARERDGLFRRIVGLHEDFSVREKTPRAARNLRDKRKGTLGSAEVRHMQSRGGADGGVVWLLRVWLLMRLAARLSGLACARLCLER